MSEKTKKPSSISRRDTLKVCLVPVGALASRLLVGCGDDKTGQDGSAAPMGSGTNGATNSAGSGGSASARNSGAAGNAQQGGAAQANAGTSGNAAHPMQPNAGSGGSVAQNDAGSRGNGTHNDAGAQPSADAGNDGIAGADVPWATGGTKAMTGGYPDPFATGASGAACKLYPAQTIGPCYADGPMMRADISDGITGLPLRLSLLVTRMDGCTPIPDATVDIWHSGSDGIYSAFATGTICNPGTMDVTSEMFCRGVQTTDENGRVDFSSVFPGWYTGRAIHIHFTIRLNGTEAATSQLYFEDALTAEILAQGSYATRGMPDTTNMTDFIFSSGGGTPDDVLLETAKRPDGVLHAWKVLSIG